MSAVHSVISRSNSTPVKAAPGFRAIPVERLTALLALGVGVGAGLFAVLFRWMIHLCQRWFMGGLAPRGWIFVVLAPAVGGLLVGPIVHFFAREARGHGVPEVMEAVALRGGRIRPRVVAAKSVASAIYIGSGGSAGAEGPIAQIGSAIGSAIGQVLRLSEERTKLLVGCGAAAGVAATFNAPVAGAIFALEVILNRFTATTFYHIVIASVAASVVGRAAFGNGPILGAAQYALVQPGELALYALLGALAAAVGWVFVRVLYGVEDFAARLKAVPGWCTPALGGLAVGLIGLGLPQALGLGYPAIEKVLAGAMPLALTAALVVAKSVTTALTLGSGGSGGVFAPSLYIGAMLGGVFGAVAHSLFPASTAVSGAYALVGMGAFFAGVSQAPITSLLIVFEMTGDYRIILPLMTACVVATSVAGWLSRDTIYTLKLKRRGVDLRAGRDHSILSGITVAEAMHEGLDVARVGMTLGEVVALMQKTRHNGFPVVDENGDLAGIITLSDIRRTPMPGRLETRVEAVMSAEPVTALPSETLAQAMVKMTARDLGRLPVVSPDDPKRLLGILTRSDVFRAYNRGRRPTAGPLPPT